MTDLELDALERDYDPNFSGGPGDYRVLHAIQRLREAEAEVRRLASLELIDGALIADQEADHHTLISLLALRNAEIDQLRTTSLARFDDIQDLGDEIRRLQNAIEVQVDLRAQLGLALDELHATRKVVKAAELLEGTGPRPILLNALEEWEELK